MDPAGNVYDDTTNTMTVGAIDSCLTSQTANPAAHNHSAHLIMQNVEDLESFQVRLNYIGQMRPSAWNATPFTDSVHGGAVGFINLPLEAGSHRSVASTQLIPDAPPDGSNTPQTALVAAAYLGPQTFPVSPDTPSKLPVRLPATFDFAWREKAPGPLGTN